MIRHLPNALTIGRALTVPFLVYLLELEHRHGPGTYALASAWIFFLAGITDYIDGLLARKLDVISRVGKLIDPLADKIIVLAALVMLAGLDRISAWIVVVIMAREFAINMLRLFAVEEGVVMPAGRGGKLKTFLQMAGITFLLLYEPYFGLPLLEIGRVLVYVSAVLAWVTGVEYFVVYFRGDVKPEKASP